MATYSFHRLKMGKVEIDNACCLNVDIFSQICLLSGSPRFIGLLSKSLNLIICLGNMMDNFSKILENLLLRNYKGHEAKTWHTC